MGTHKLPNVTDLTSGRLQNTPEGAPEHAFVDDTDLIETEKKHRETIYHVIFEMHEGLDLWVGLIQVTGGH